MMQLAYIVICSSLVLHFSNRWYRLTRSLMEEAGRERMRNAVDWNNSSRTRRPAKKMGIVEKLKVLG